MKFNPNIKHNPTRVFHGYWMQKEIRAHSSPLAFPDWSCVWKTHKQSKRRKARYNECKTTREKTLLAANLWRQKNQELVKSQKSEWQKSLTPEKRRETYLRYWEKNKNQIRKRARQKSKSTESKDAKRAAEKKRLENPSYRLRKNIGRGLASICSRQGVVKNSSVLMYVGCSMDELYSHLESKFKNGMKWENYGSVWHVDHIIPCASFDHSDLNQVRQCWHWTNLQPLKAKQNMFKADKMTHPQMSLLLSP